ncbi:hypothetical protein ACFQ0I_08800 [Mariniflexile aquimaris]|uniref:Four helix bundle protein n=1 Tax=Mariniflexile aquimaris TaxID=881009 RepID=A0ABW3BTI5_9FLAO
MENKEFAKKLELRTLQFAVSINKMSSSLPKTAEGLVIRNQITKSGTSYTKTTLNTLGTHNFKYFRHS